MTEKLELELHNRQQAWAIIKSQLYPFLANVLNGGGKWVLTVSRPSARRQSLSSSA